MVAGRRNRDEQRVAQTNLHHALTQLIPALEARRLHLPEIELELALGGAGLGERLVWAELIGEVTRHGERAVVDFFLDALRQLARRLALERQLHLEEDVLQAHEPQAHGTPAVVRRACFGGRVEIDVDDAVEVLHRDTHTGALAVVVHLELTVHLAYERAEVDGAEVTDRGLAFVGDFDDLGAEVRAVHDLTVGAAVAGLVALGVRGVLEGHPAVTGLGEGAHHARVELACLHLAREVSLRASASR